MTTNDFSHRCRDVVAAALLLSCSALGYGRSPPPPALSATTSIDVVYYASPPLSVQTPVSAVGSNLITIATKSYDLSEGGSLQRAYQLEDSVKVVADRLVEELKVRKGMDNLRVVAQPLLAPRPEDKDTGIYKAAYSGEYVLELAGGPRASYKPLNWKTYWYQLSILGRLIRSSDGTVAQKLRCNAFGMADKSLTLGIEEFEANDGARFKQVVHDAETICVRRFVEELSKGTAG